MGREDEDGKGCSGSDVGVFLTESPWESCHFGEGDANSGHCPPVDEYSAASSSLFEKKKKEAERNKLRMAVAVVCEVQHICIHHFSFNKILMLVYNIFLTSTLPDTEKAKRGFRRNTQTHTHTYRRGPTGVYRDMMKNEEVGSQKIA